MTPPRRVPPDPLSRVEREAVARVGDRLRTDLEALVLALPAHVRGGAPMSRLLQVDRSTCQRIVTAVARGTDAHDVLRRLPGPEGLRGFCDAVARRRVGAELVTRARDAVEAFEQLIDELAGSHSALNRRLSAHHLEPLGPAEGRTQEALREQAHEALAILTGRRTGTQSNTLVLREVPDDPSRVQVVSCRSFLGLRGRAGAPPVSGVFFSRSDNDVPWGEPGPRPLADDEPGSGTLLRAFSSDPPPRISARTAGDVTLQMIEPPGPAQDPLDVTIGYRLEPPLIHPALQDEPRLDLIHHCVVPTGTLLLHAYLERGLARRCIASASVHQPTDNRATDLSGSWFDRLDQDLSVEVLGPDLDAATHPDAPRQGELVRHLFEQVGWDPEGFVGHRVQVRFPIWSCSYVLSFDFEQD